MSNILDLAVGDLITAKVYTYHLNNVEKEYTNTYEFRCNAIGVGTTELEGLAVALKDFHVSAHHNDCWIDRVVLSSYEAEEGGYDPLSFIVFPMGFAGTRAVASDALAADIVLYMKRKVAVGRTGKLHLRLSLAEQDINAPAGKIRLANPAAIATEFATYVGDSGLLAYLVGLGGGSHLQMVMASEVGTPPSLLSRLVQDLEVAGVRDTNPNHKYFDRA